MKIKNSEVTGDYKKIKTIDMHTCGEPVRVILDGYPDIEGKTILEKRNFVKEKLDHLRTALMFEPRGHADMYGLLVVSPQNQDSNFGVLFMHNEGYSTMCGHATIAITKLAVQLGWVKKTAPVTRIKIDAPCGQLNAYAEIGKNGEIEKVKFDCVPSFVVALDEQVEIAGIGTIQYDLAYGGAFYAYVDADSISLSLDKGNTNQIIDYGRRIKQAVIANKDNILHPLEDDLSFLYGTIFITEKSPVHSKNVCVFADGEVDRSPTGSGLSGRAAIHYQRGDISLDESITVESILGTRFDVKVIDEVNYGGYKSVIPQVTGNAYITGEHTFLIDGKDDLRYGFLLR